MIRQNSLLILTIIWYQVNHDLNDSFLKYKLRQKIKSLTKLFNSKVIERDDDDDDAFQNISIMRLVLNIKVF